MATTASVPLAEAARPREADPRLINDDLAPTPVGQRTWTGWNFAALWMGMVHSAFGFSVLGGMIAGGMSAWQALFVVLIANLIQLALMILTGRVGARFGIPFAVWARAAFGSYGANVPALLRGFVAIGWFGVQSYLGATAINALLGAVFDGWKGFDSVIGGVAANLWVAMIVYWALNFLIIRHGMETVRRFEGWAGPMVFVVMVPLLIWSIDKAHGLGPVFHESSKYGTTGAFFIHGFLPGVALFISASWATMVLNLPDLTRFARSNREQVRGTLIGLPLATIVFYGMAAIIVSGTQAHTGKLLWNPSDVLVAIDIPAFTIVGAILIAVATMSVNLAANIVSPAYDITNVAPRIFTFKRAASLAIVLGFVYMPWKLMESPDTLFRVLNNVGAVIGPATGILIADFYLIRRGRLDVGELYRRQSRYWGRGGFNWLTLSVLATGTVICLLGQVIDAIDWTYEYAWFVGLGLGFVLHLLAVTLARRSRGGELPVEFQPAGTTGVEAAEPA
ncbi:MAG TPA: NCS1 family nucleobase:cation symporter-1 [Solirubrobacter sp.]|nr:NCS1 family nucleobase:cation symporter-1 [Solirubrobacter sp.]